jgi:hypothetical protein
LILLPFLLPAILASAANVLRLEPANPDCGEVWTRGDLHIKYFTGGQSCPPGGPCELMGVHNLSPAQVSVQVAGCKGRLPGRFVATERRCRSGVKLYRFTGHVPPGRDLTLYAPRTTHGYFRSPGRRVPLDCTGSPPLDPLGLYLAILQPGYLPEFLSSRLR